MTQVLEYAHPRVGGRPNAIPAPITLTLLTYAHLNLCWQISRLMLVPVCERLGHQFFAWTPVGWLPGSVATLVGGPGLGAAVMFFMSLFAGRIMQGVLATYHDGRGEASASFCAMRASGWRWCCGWGGYPCRR